MKPLSSESISYRDFPIYRLIPIDLISHDRMTHVGRMYADLVRTSCEELDLEERISVIDILETSVLGPSKFGIDRIFGRHLLMIRTIIPDIRLDQSFFFHDFSYDDRIVDLADFPCCDLSLEFLHRAIILRDDDESTRVLVETMDDPWTFDTTYGRRISEMIEERIQERSCLSIFSWECMGIHPCILADDRKIRILKNNFKWYILCFEIILLCLEIYIDHISELNSSLVSEYLPIHSNIPRLDELMDIRSRELWKCM